MFHDVTYEPVNFVISAEQVCQRNLKSRCVQNKKKSSQRFSYLGKSSVKKLKFLGYDREHFKKRVKINENWQGF